MERTEAAGSAWRSLERVRYEVLPLPSIEAELDWLPAGATVTVTSSPSRGIVATLALCERLAGRVGTVVPHLAARLVRDRRHLAAIVAQLDGLGVREVFVVAGDTRQAAGRYEGAVDLLRDLAGLGHPFTAVGITGYPESHAFISDAATIHAMAAKAPLATYVVSQMCFDPAAVVAWIGAVRARGITLPIHLGIPGAVDLARLTRISLRIGLGDSVRFLRRQRSRMARVAAGYRPDRLVEGLLPSVDDPAAGVAGWHVFTFNEIRRTEQWRRALLDAQGAPL